VDKNGWEVLSVHLVGSWPCFSITVRLSSIVLADALLNLLFWKMLTHSEADPLYF